LPVHRGSCHCGRVRFEVDASIDRLSRCNCSICSAKGALYVPIDAIRAFRITAGESELTAYRFQTETATHFFCRHCGVHPFHRPRFAPDRWSVNARCIEDLDLEALPVVEFDGRNWETAARARGWPG
jgi:hypothetical protein